MKKVVTILSLLLLATVATVSLYSCKKKDKDSDTAAQALSIQTGARNIQPDEQVTYTAVLVDSKGNTTPATGVEWSVTGNGGSTIGAITGGVFKPSASGYGTIKAKITVDGKELTATVPVGIYLPAVFAVVPSAIVWTTGAGDIPLSPVYLGTETLTGYTYSSSDPSVATVSSTGSVSFLKAGECLITVTGNGLSGNNKVYVPVLVVGMPTVTLPVVRVAVNPAGKEMFRGETFTFAAHAYNSSNTEVTNTTFTWASSDPNIATVDATGKVTAVALGKTIITATGSGITGQAEVDVLPDTTILVTPFMASIGPNGTKQFTAKAYAVNKTSKTLSEISMPAGLTWIVPTTGIAMFDIAGVNSTGLVTMNSTATIGMSTVVIAHVASPTIAEGAALLMVSDCDCGTTTPGVTAINVTSGTTLNLNMSSPFPVTVNATAVDAGGNPVSGATVKLCSDNITAATVSGNQIFPSGIGTAIVTVCNGSVSTTITVNVAP